MPVRLTTKIERLSQAEFADIAYEVVRQAFQVQNELGRFFDEKIYQRELAFRLPGSQTEVKIEVCFRGFAKTYYIDLVVGAGAIFELKTVQTLASQHHGQLLNYLLLADAAHGKLINFRPERVQHEFVNSSLRYTDRIVFEVDDGGQEDGGLKERLIALLRDWGTGLDLNLYEEAAAFLCGRGEEPLAEIPIHMTTRDLGLQPVRLATPDTALRITGLPEGGLATYEAHLRRFLIHTDLRAIQWINITPVMVRFRIVKK